jgi:error-prone DNA polymerase
MPSSRFRTDDGMSFIMGAETRSTGLPKGPRPRDVVDPYLHLDAIKVRTRDFR